MAVQMTREGTIDARTAPAGHATRPPRPAPVTPPARHLLRLQAAAGNAAVTQLVRGARPGPPSVPVGPVGPVGPVAHPPAHPPAHVQRRVGYEFETTNISWQFKEKHVDPGTGGESWRLKKDTKSNLIPLGSAAHLNADNGNVEFVTEPLSTYQEVRDAITAIVGAYHRLLRERQTEFSVSGTDYQITTLKQDSLARPQATFGIQMRNISQLIKELEEMRRQDQEPGERAEDADESQAKRQRRTRSSSKQDPREAALRRRITAVDGPAGGLLRANHGDALHLLAKLPTWPTLSKVEHTNAAAGFVTVLLRTIRDSAAASAEDPKYLYALMARTDFASMLGTLPPETHAVLTKSWRSGSLHDGFDELLKQTGAKEGVDGPLLGRRPKNVTIRAWIDSIFDPGRNPDTNGRDLLSPPPGYEAHDTPGRANEGIGALRADSVDPEKSVFELRDLGIDLPVDQYLPLALMVADLIGRATGDNGLRKP